MTPLRSLAARLAPIAVAFTSLACSAFRAPLTPPEAGGPAWRQLTSDHFVLKTDADPHTAQRALEDLERSHAALAFVTRRPPREVEGPVEVVLFAETRDFLASGARKLSASAWFSAWLGGDLEPQPVIVMADSVFAEETRNTVQHELTHRFLHERFPHLPPWLDEGLAQYYASAQVEGGRIVLGAATTIDFSPQPYFWIARKKEGFEQEQVPLYLAPTVRRLVEADRQDFYLYSGEGGPTRKDSERQAASYAGAWKLVHFLLNGPNASYRARFVAFLDDLQRGARARDAFLERFGDDWAGLEQAYRDYLRVEQFPVAVAAYPEPKAARTPAERPLSAAEVHVLWARLMPWSKDGYPQVRKQLDAALDVAPGDPEALARRALLHLREGEPDAFDRDLAAALAARPDDPQLLLAKLAADEQRAKRAGVPVDAATERALWDRLARTAASAHELNDLAWHDLKANRLDDGLARVARALRADPLCSSCEDTRAMLLLEKGRLEEASAALDRALSLAPERESVSVLLDHRRKIEEARATAGRRPHP